MGGPTDIEDEFDTGFDAQDEFARPAPDEPAPAEEEPVGSDPFEGLAEVAQTPPPRGNPVGEMQAGLEAGLGQSGIPHIAIHIFCQKPSTAALAERASRDRRLARATTIVRPGGLAGAVEHYQNEPTPSLVMVESAERSDVMLGLLDQLAEVCDPGTKVIVIGAANDIALYRELMRRGVSEYLTPPLEPMQLINAVSTLYSDPASPFAGRQVAFVPAKGGVGSSTICHNFAYALAERMQTNAVIVDFDLAFGTAGLDFNQDPLQGVANALTQTDRLDPVLLERMMVKCGERLSLFAAPATLEDEYEISPDAFDEVSTKVRAIAPFIVLDMPHLWNGWMRRLLLGSDEVVLTATPDLASLRNAKNLIDLLKQNRPNDAPPRLVLNQVGVPGRPEIPVKDFGEALGIQPALVLPFDAKLFGKAANNGQMLSEVGPKSKVAEGLDHLAQMISRREPAPVAKRGGSLSALFKRK
jgi:pilus assembly protein CpaE